jgi:ketosteroid isomerase-like protein
VKPTHLFGSVALLASLCLATQSRADSASDRVAVEATGAAIRAAFAAGNVAEIMRYHHPDVRKALSFTNVEVGGEAVAAGLQDSLRQFHVEFVENNVESLLIEGDTAIEQTLFAIKATPLAGGRPSIFRGRTMVVYVRYKDSPTGWASIRELIQPATN